MNQEHQHKFTSLSLNKLDIKEQEWLNIKLDTLKQKPSQFNTFFSLASRKLSKQNLEFNEYESFAFNQIYPGFTKTPWTALDLGRSLMMMALKTTVNQSIIQNFYESSEMQEQVSLYKGLYCLENAEDFTLLVAEGIRTNMGNVFEAIALGNPFGNTYLDEGAWNQLILKLFFMEKPLFLVQFVDQGKNENLGQMLQEYVKERWAAGRAISPEIWRMIEGYLNDDVESIIKNNSYQGLENKALNYILDNHDRSESHTFWNNIGQEYLKQKQ